MRVDRALQFIQRSPSLWDALTYLLSVRELRELLLHDVEEESLEESGPAGARSICHA